MLKPMNVAIALNQKYFYYTYVMLTSLYENNQDLCVHTYIMHSDLSLDSLKAFGELAKKFGGQIHELKVDRTMFPENLPINEQWSLETYYRLVLLDILPEQVDRLLYIDVDTIVNQSVRELYDTEFGDSYFVVCQEKGAEKPADNCRWEVFRPIFESGYHYFNAGVMLWNVKALRGKYCLQTYLDAACEINYQFMAPDQDLLNYVHHSQVKFVDENRYNLFARIASNKGLSCEEVKAQTAIIHYAGSKPWNADNIHYDIEWIWWEYARKTPYFAQLCEEFVRKTMLDKSMIEYVQQLLKENGELRQNLDESLKVNEKLVGYVRSFSEN